MGECRSCSISSICNSCSSSAVAVVVAVAVAVAVAVDTTGTTPTTYIIGTTDATGTTNRYYSNYQARSVPYAYTHVRSWSNQKILKF